MTGLTIVAIIDKKITKYIPILLLPTPRHEFSN
jgi:hypothetical protein